MLNKRSITFIAAFTGKKSEGLEVIHSLFRIDKFKRHPVSALVVPIQRHSFFRTKVKIDKIAKRGLTFVNHLYSRKIFLSKTNSKKGVR